MSVRRVLAAATSFGLVTLTFSQVPQTLTESEATALLALVPEIARASHQGFAILYGREPGDRLNQNDYFHFRIVVRTEAPSGLIGYYSVNKWTADVWDSGPTLWVCTPELDAAQLALRAKKQINDQVISKYRDLPLFSGDTSAGHLKCRE